jgi:hypothetical protein
MLVITATVIHEATCKFVAVQAQIIEYTEQEKKVMAIISGICTLKVHPKKPIWRCITTRYC